MPRHLLWFACRAPCSPTGSAARAPLLKPMPQPPATHVPPQNIEAEESVLGAMLVAESTLTRVIDEVKLHRSDFYLDKHREIFEAVHDLYAGSQPVDELSVSEALTQRNKIDAAGGRHYISELAAKVPAAANAKHYA